MRVLITGASGFAGTHLSSYLKQHASDMQLFGTVYESQVTRKSTDHFIYEPRQIDLMSQEAVTELISDIQPEHIYHLAAQSSPSKSLRQPWDTIERNLRMQFNLLQACIHTQIWPRILIVSSGEIYRFNMDGIAINEDVPFNPTTPYSVSKIAQDMMGLQYYTAYNLPIIRARPFNHTGPGQSESFVAPDFAIQIARIEHNLQEPVISVGNLNAERDFTDVRDVVRAYALLMQSGIPGEVYNIASGTTCSIQRLLKTLLSFTDADIKVQVDPSRTRPVDIPSICGEASRLRQTTGWQPQYMIQDTLRAILDDCRARVAGTHN